MVQKYIMSKVKFDDGQIYICIMYVFIRIVVGNRFTKRILLINYYNIIYFSGLDSDFILRLYI